MHRYENIAGLLESVAKKYPNRNAYTFILDVDLNTSSITYSELATKVKSIATELRKKVKKGERVLLIYPPGIELIAAFYACLYAGIIAVPVYPPINDDLLNKLLLISNDAKCRACISTKEAFNNLKKINFARKINTIPLLNKLIPKSITKHLERLSNLKNWKFDDLEWIITDTISNENTAAWQGPEVEANDVAFLQYTSGSTGNPKGVMVSHGNLLHNLHEIQQSFKANENDRLLVWLPPYHDMGLIGGILFPLYCRFTGYLIPPQLFIKCPIIWLEAMTKFKTTGTSAPNFAYELCVDKITTEEIDKLDLSLLRIAMVGAEPVRANMMERFAEKFSTCGFSREAFKPAYGLAENTLLVSTTQEEFNIYQPTESQLLVGVGTGIANHEVIVVNNETKRVCAEKEVGEIWISGPSVAQGYWQKPKETAETFQAFLADSRGPFLKTGDLGFYEDNELVICGRLKEMLILNGRNYYPQDIEGAIDKSHPLLKLGHVVAFSSGYPEEKLIIAAETNIESDIAEYSGMIDAIKRTLAERFNLSPFNILLLPKRSIKRTTSGKLCRQHMRLQYQNNELTILHLWENTLKKSAVPDLASQTDLLTWVRNWLANKFNVSIEKIEPNKNIFSLGLDSFTSAELITDLNVQWNHTLDFADVWKYPILSDLVNYLVTSKKNKSRTILQPVKVDNGVLPTSYVQKNFWFLNEIFPENNIYNMHFAAEICTSVNKDILKQSFSKLLKRHNILRSVYFSDNKDIWQNIKSESNTFWREVNAEGWSKSDLDQHILKTANEPFDLKSGPLFLVYLYQQANASYLLLKVHHIVVDHWSIVVLLREFGVIYNRLVNGNHENLPECKFSYMDYIAYQKEFLSSELSEKQSQYWLKQLSGELPILKLPTDHLRPPISKKSGKNISFDLDEDLVKQLKDLAKNNHTTLFTLLLTAFQCLLHRYTKQQDFIIGVPISGRQSHAFANTIGCFVNILPIRASISEHDSFIHLLENSKKTLGDGIANSDYPLSLLTDKIKIQRSMNQMPLFQVLFNQTSTINDSNLVDFFNHKDNALVKLDSLELRLLNIEQNVAEFDLNIMISELSKQLHFSWQYDAELFDQSTIERFIQDWQLLLVDIVTMPSLSVCELINPKKENSNLIDLAAARQNHREGKTVIELFEIQAMKTPEGIAVCYEDKSFTYAELNERANQVAHYLQVQGIKPDDLVGICMERSLELIICLLGTLKAGAAYIPLDPSHPQDRIAFILEDTAADLVLTTTTLLNTLPKSSVKLVCFDSDSHLLEHFSKSNLNILILPEQLVYVIYTSGSTGKPKGVLQTHGGICNSLLGMQDQMHLSVNDNILQHTSIGFDVSAEEIFHTLGVGSCLIMFPDRFTGDLATMAKFIHQYKISVLHIVPSVLQILLTSVNLDLLASLRLVVAAGEALSVNLQNLFFDTLNADLTNGYGPTEAFYVTYYKCQRNQHASTLKSIPIGKPLANEHVYILDDNQQHVSAGITGEVYLGGASIARGYLNRPELTETKFITNPFATEDDKQSNINMRLYKTGDLARYLPDMNIEYLGRIDNQVKIRGHRIELGEIESVLNMHHSIQQGVVIVRMDQNEQPQLVAYILSKNSQQNVSDLREYLSEHLPSYMVPNCWMFVNKFPTNSNGKLDYASLPLPDDKSLITDEPPHNDLERDLIAIWASVLGKSTISVKDNFFEIGGHSLMAVQLINILSEKYNVDLAIHTLFKHPTIEMMANFLREQIKRGVVDNKESSLVTLNNDGNNTPLFFVHPGDGNILCYAPLVKELDRDRPYYGLQQIESASIEQLASSYINEIRSVQVKGPYNLIGWSLGGTIAHEIAYQLEQLEEEVAFLGLIDSYTPKLMPADLTSEILMSYFKKILTQHYNVSSTLTDSDFDSVTVSKQLQDLADDINKSHLLPKKITADELKQILARCQHNFESLIQHQPKKINSSITLFVTDEKVEQADLARLEAGRDELVKEWMNYSQADLKTHRLGGNHFSALHRSNMSVLIRVLQDGLFD